MNIYQLKWSQVCPDRYTFDSSLALPIAIDAIRNTPMNTEYPARWAQAVEDEIDRSFIEAYGDWAAGWCFSRGEGSLDGGVITAWCCPSHSVLCSGPLDDVTFTAQNAANGLMQWHEHLKEVKQLFRRLKKPRRDSADHAALDLHSATSRIISYVVEATAAESGWHGYAHMVLSWYLQSLRVVSVKASQEVASQAISGRFRSWTTPDKATVDAVADAYKAKIVPLLMGKKNTW